MASKETNKVMQQLYDMLHINETVNEVKECLNEIILAGKEQDGIIPTDLSNNNHSMEV